MRHWILSGDLKPGDRLPSYNETRAQYGVHTSTMEKVFAKLEGEGLIVRRRGSGTFVAKQSKKSTHGVIGLTGVGFSFNGYSSYWAQLMDGVREAAAKVDTQILMLESESNRGWEKADGVLVCGWALHRVAPFRAFDVPIVSLLVPVPGVASVSADDYNGSRQATEYLLELGHRRIGVLNFFSGQPVLAQRMDGYANALKAAKIRPLKIWERSIGGRFMLGNQIVKAAREEMKRWLQDESTKGWRKAGCTALLCHNDETALGVIQALQSSGVKVPDDVSVIGFDGTEFCDLVSPKLSSVQLPLREIGAAGVEMLLQQIADDEVSIEHRVLPVKLREGESSAAPSP